MTVKETYKELVVEAGKTMLDEGLTVGTWGNISVRDPQTGLVYLSPSGMAYHEILPDDIVVMDLDEKVVDGHRVVSIEKLVHLAIYRARPDVNAIMHTHPLYSSVLGAVGMELPAISEDFAQLVGDKIICSDYALPGTKELSENVVVGLGADRNAVILPNHGTFCVGADIRTTFIVSHVVEKSAQTYILALGIGKPNIISQANILQMREDKKKHYGQR
jgi:L-fuculose-phosphate aldolase